MSFRFLYLFLFFWTNYSINCVILQESYKKKIEKDTKEQEQIKNINSMCGRKDTLIILGDVGNIDCVRRLRAAREYMEAE